MEVWRVRQDGEGGPFVSCRRDNSLKLAVNPRDVVDDLDQANYRQTVGIHNGPHPRLAHSRSRAPEEIRVRPSLPKLPDQ